MPRTRVKLKLAHRVVGLFVLCALVPLAAATYFLTSDFDAHLRRSEQRDLDGAIRGFATAFVGRLGSADDVLKALVETAGSPDASIQDEVARIVWVRSVRRMSPNEWPISNAQRLPQPTTRQRRALDGGDSVALWGFGASGSPQLYLVRKLRSGDWLYAELKPEWVLADADDYATSASLLLFDGSGHTLLLVGKVPPDVVNGAIASMGTRAGRAPRSGGADEHEVSGGWLVRSKEIFLAGRFNSPSLYAAALLPSHHVLTDAGSTRVAFPAIAALTVLLVSVLSIIVIRRQLRPLEELTEATRRVARREFSGELSVTSSDEFGILAQSFNRMTQDLQSQFSALETLADIDRLLLRTPDLERILDTLLPRVASLLRCHSLSVLLVDPHLRDHARVYDCFAARPDRRPVRRVAIDINSIQREYEHSAQLQLAQLEADHNGFLIPLAEGGARTFRLFSLQHDGRFSGLFVVGRDHSTESAAEPGVSEQDFADRLSVVLGNLERAETLHMQAHYDSLTRLPNRQLFADRVNVALSQAREGGGRGAVLYIDLDHFKRVNDTAGHSAGDELLRIVSVRLASCIREGDSIARLGGDEFAVLLPRIVDEDTPRQIAERALASLQQPFSIAGREHHVAASIGVTVFPTDGVSVEDLLKTSDIAMYRAKESGRARAVFFESEMQERMHARIALETGLHRALQKREFKLLYQPILGATGAESLGVEALLRWPNGPDGASKSPAVFVPVAEESGLIVELGEWILRAACRQFESWRREGLTLDYVSVNVSARQLRDSSLLASISAALEETGMRPSELQLEITESVLADGATTELTLKEIAALGVRVALDDFGTGYSSLSYLRRYPIHTVKIDRAFITALPDDVNACRLAESIIVMCAALEKQVVAEGVENEAQRRFLLDAGCRGMQGYLLGRPMEAVDVPGFARRVGALTDHPPTVSYSPAAAVDIESTGLRRRGSG